MSHVCLVITRPPSESSLILLEFTRQITRLILLRKLESLIMSSIKAIKKRSKFLYRNSCRFLYSIPSSRMHLRLLGSEILFYYEVSPLILSSKLCKELLRKDPNGIFSTSWTLMKSFSPISRATLNSLSIESSIDT